MTKVKPKTKLDNFIFFPRYIGEMLIRGEIDKMEYHLYMWTRIRCDAMGICRHGLESINDDLFSGKYTTNYINKKLLSLKSKRLIWYKNRQGARGSFEIHHGELSVIGGGVRTLDKCFDDPPVRSGVSTQSPSQSEVGAEVEKKNQKLKERVSRLKSSDSFSFDRLVVRSDDNDKDKDKDKLNIDSKTFKESKPIPVQGFESQDSNTFRCHEIAKLLGEQDMRFILSALKRCGLAVIENAYGLVKEGDDIEYPRKYFNKIINNLPCFKEGSKNGKIN